MEQLKTDVAYECRHAVGHAVFYSLALREQNLRPDVCNQFRPGSYTLGMDFLRLAGRICRSGGDALAVHCMNGVEHSYNLLRTPATPEHWTDDDDLLNGWGGEQNDDD